MLHDSQLPSSRNILTTNFREAAITVKSTEIEELPTPIQSQANVPQVDVISPTSSW
jgi:hypothetical protein